MLINKIKRTKKKKYGGLTFVKTSFDKVVNCKKFVSNYIRDDGSFFFVLPHLTILQLRALNICASMNYQLPNVVFLFWVMQRDFFILLPFAVVFKFYM